MKYYTLFLIILISCAQKELSVDEIIQQSILAHGLHDLDGKTVTFTFRDKDYSVMRSEGAYTYTRSYSDSLGFINDVLVNSTDFTRTIDGKENALTKEWSDLYANSVNSVLYFFQLPLTLQDPAAIKKLIEIQEIDGNEYYVIEVRFSEEDGGKDHEDLFLYWFHTETYLMDFLAYSYLTDGGGSRFRKVINRRTEGGFVFQDYINYKSTSKEIPLDQLVEKYKQGKLVELSRIENKDVSITP